MSLAMCRCGGIVENDTCSKCGPKKRFNDGEKYYGYKWDQFARLYKKEHPLCVNCLQDGLIKPSEEVHHVVSVADAPELKFEESNLKALCIQCHKREDNKRRHAKQWRQTSH